MTERTVPCNGCFVCCVGDAIYLQSGDDIKSYETEVYKGRLILAHKENGDCIYLDREAGGCSIHERRPLRCRQYDCARLLQLKPVRRKQLVRKGILNREILNAARQRVQREGTDQ